MIQTNEFHQQIDAVREFNRFYTKQIGTLDESLLDSSFSLTEARILYEMAQRNDTTATALRTELALNGGYLSRVLRGLQGKGLVAKTQSERDARQSLLRLTAKGQEEFSLLNRRSQNEIAAMLGSLHGEDQRRLVNAMQVIERLLDTQPAQATPYILRPHRPGDMGWVIHRHAVLYTEEYGWDEQFEALVAQITADFLKNFIPRKECCWIAEVDGENVGSVFVVKESETVAKLRMLLVEPKARGLGIGGRLVDECIRFAQSAGYTTLTLWTNSILHAARHLYKKSGFQLVHEEAHHSFGHDLVGETWELSYGIHCP